ncbi:CdaR family transcriptional regulator [Parafrankia sp. EUN1f]|uniref:PucR family transcriptional regulator n=1 Tax=Parafrankia sp. EUN1f TaxID=102897 RepID=UPI0001C47043|nr:helix-turn-helix domain-containing protein [Parafrankia sp. EUN1f]EFC80520.1 transcriptional regulator, CdaR [Parafrankia sp. EUN1f]
MGALPEQPPAALARASRRVGRAPSEPGLTGVLATAENLLGQLVEHAVDAIWAQVPAYRTSTDGQLREDVTAHVQAVFRALLASVAEQRPTRAEDLAPTRAQSRRRARQEIPLADLLQAFLVGQLTLWERMVAATRADSGARAATLALAADVMRLTEAGTAAAAESYLDEQRFQLADSDRLRRDVLEDLLAARELPDGPKRSLLLSVGLGTRTRIVALSAVPVAPLSADQQLRDAASTLRRAVVRGGAGLVVVRQAEIVAVSPVPACAAEVVERLEALVDALGRDGVRLAVGVSAVHDQLADLPEAYSEARLARRSLGEHGGVVVLPLLSSFDYLLMRDDSLARQLVRPAVRRFVEEDSACGSRLIKTFLAYTASNLNAKTAAELLHLHANTAYYRLERIAERTGCDLRSVEDVIELVVAIRLLAPGSVVRRPERPGGRFVDESQPTS